MLVTEFGILMVSKTEQAANAESPMLVTESGISTFFKAMQPWNMSSRMLVTELGISMVSKALQNSLLLHHVSHRICDLHTSQSFTILESAVPNSGHGVGDLDFLQRRTEFEGLIPYIASTHWDLHKNQIVV